MKIVAIHPRPALFQSVRSSHDHALVAFAAALLAAFVVHAGALAPRLDLRSASPAAAPTACSEIAPALAGGGAAGAPKHG